MIGAKYIARFLGRRPRMCLLVSLGLCAFFTAIAAALGNLRITFDSKGWKSRGTVIAKRAMQSDIVMLFRENLFYDSFSGMTADDAMALYDSPWDYMQRNVIPGYIKIGTFGRRLTSGVNHYECGSSSWYSEMNQNLDKNYLSAVWMAKQGRSLLDPESLLEMCKAERVTAETLSIDTFCNSCQGNICPLPHSLVTLISEELGFSRHSTCEAIVESYYNSRDDMTDRLVECSKSMRTISGGNCTLPMFASNLVDSSFGVDNNYVLEYSSSVFFSSDFIGDDNAKELYRLHEKFGKTDTNILTVVYDTTMNQDLNILAQTDFMFNDVTLAFVSVVVTTSAIFFHTKSAWLTLIGSLQILFAAPLAYCVYYFIGGLKFFPIINLIGLFVSSALGADDLFVAVDKWKNARIANPTKSTEEVAEMALPDAAAAMLLTTSTTGVAFFATCITPVPPIFTFALFCGLLVVFNYILNCALVFPALCLYDGWIMQGKNKWMTSLCCRSRNKGSNDAPESVFGDTSNQVSLIHKILSWYYNILHKFKLPTILLMSGALAVSTYFAIGIKLPENSDVRMLPSRISFEKHFERSKKLLSHERLYAAGSRVRIYFGLKPADTGSYRNPDTLSALVLDETFDPSPYESQLYLKDFCSRLWAQDFADAPLSYTCSINAFDDWLGDQFSLGSGLQDTGYVNFCNSSTNSLPMNETYFHKCFSYWKRNVDANNNGRLDVLDREGIVKIMWFEATVPVRPDDPYNRLNRAWKTFENWVTNDGTTAPPGVKNVFHSAAIWWWKDTNGQMLSTALGAAAIALLFSAVVVLVSSRSLRLTLFSCLSISYILAGATASLVGIGWTLGFLESVCFAILIGISCDFVIHFGHAYISFEGFHTRDERTKYATIHMGPSILAAAMTTFFAAVVMIFCTLKFFTQFSQMLLLTITHAIIGSFIVYLVLCDTFGPAEPTKLYDNVVSSLCAWKDRNMNKVDASKSEKPTEIETLNITAIAVTIDNTHEKPSKAGKDRKDSFHDDI